MSAVAAATLAPSGTMPRAFGSTLTGTWRLVRFMLRRDRVRLTVWVLVVTALYASQLGEYAVLADDPNGLATRALLMRTPAMISMAGPGYGLDSYTVGAAVANELVLWIVLTLAVLSILQVVRHTRAEEESGRSELVRAGAVGRHAPSVAALITVLLANVVIAALTGAVLVSAGLPAVDSFAMTAGSGLAALVFGAAALVACQVTEHARGASGLGFAVLGAAFVLRAIGDIQEEHGSVLSWLSPIGWAQQTRSFVDLRWWPLALCVVAIVLLLLLAAFLASRRDFGSGLVATRRGRADAYAGLDGPFALAWTQQRSALLWTSLGLGVMWLATGSILSALPDMMETLRDNPIYSTVLGEGDLVRAFIGIMGLYAAFGGAGYAVAMSLRVKAEEESGLAEYLLATPVSRARWLGAYLAVAGIGTAVVTMSGVVALWVGAAGAGVTDPTFGEFVGLGAAYLPALAVLTALAVALYAWVPRATPVLWALFGYMFVVGLFGELLGLPDWARGISPFWWVPNTLVQDVEVADVVGLCAVAVVLFAVAFAGFRRRDVPTV
ncbi:hypothetical protein L1785_19680 [Antribacter sp. KLBMP9083]|uniref:Polyketide antibiotic transporter n=1 Tax=Antribacter soli TaxID=2910976 RepID=A0AA41UDL0_9MICO|nr:hypothetical protein [Antribacter soli]MCF4123194.1 hypothetical protein [Antribacter soli]